MMYDRELENAVVVDFPLRGEWITLNTPARRIPSHGTDLFGQRYAYDFLKLHKGKPFKGSVLKYILLGIPVRNCYCWKKEIYACLEGEVVEAIDGVKEPDRVHPIYDFIRMLIKSAQTSKQLARPDKYDFHSHTLAGNYIIIKHDGFFSFYAHLHHGTVAVKTGQRVREGDYLGRVGHTGNSTSPHQHFHLMDSEKPMQAKGIPCSFRELEVQEEEGWRKVAGAIPEYGKTIRRADGIQQPT